MSATDKGAEENKKKYNRELLKASPAEFKNFSREDQRYWVYGRLAFKSNFIVFKDVDIPPDADDSYVGGQFDDEEEPEEVDAPAESESSEESELSEEESEESSESDDEPKSKEPKMHHGPKGLVYPGSQTTAFDA